MCQIDGLEEFRCNCMLQKLGLFAKTLSQRLLPTSSGVSGYKSQNSQGEGVRRSFLKWYSTTKEEHTLEVLLFITGVIS
jgi:hypothetical protein